MLSGISLAINRPGGGVPLWGQASLDFDFTTMLALPAGTTFARASTATYADSTGTLKTAAVDEARFTFEPYRLIPRGYLTEPARTNVLLNSANLTQSGWTASSAGTTAEVAGAPTGNAEASRMLEDTENAVHSVSQSVSSSTTTPWTGSVWLKPSGRTWARVQLDFDTQYRRVWVNLSTGALGTEDGTATSVVAARAERWQNGWVRVWLTASSSSGATRGLTVATALADQGVSHAGESSKGLLVFGAQLENASSVSSYIPTTSAAVTRAADSASFVGSSLFTAVGGSAGGSLFVDSVSLEGQDTGSASVVPVTLANSTASAVMAARRDDAGAASFQAQGYAVISSVAYTINGSNSTFPAFEPTRVGVSARATSGMEVASSGAVLATRSLDTGSYQVDRVYLGVSTALASTFVGTIARVGAWRRRLETIELQVLTTVPPFLLLDPSITGTPTNGQTLTAVAAQPSGTSSTRTYQWNRGGTPIDGATSDTYTLVAADVGQSITVTQTETNSAGAASATSPGVGPVLEA